MKQTKTTLKELTAMYRAVLRHGILCNAIALGLIATATPAMAEYTNVSLDELYPTGTAGSFKYTDNQNVTWLAENISVTEPGDGRAIEIGKNAAYSATEPTLLHLGGDNTNTININTGGDGILVRTKSVVDVHANDTISITSTVNDPSYDGGVGYGALWVQNSSDPGQTDTYATVNLTANQINLTNLNASAIAALSEGRVNINGNATIKGKDAIYASGLSVTNINAAGDKTVKMDGDIDFRQGPKSSAPVDATVNVTLNGAESYWTGNTVLSYEKKPSDDKLQINHGATIKMTDGATWTATDVAESAEPGVATNGRYYTALKNLDVNSGNVVVNRANGIEIENLAVGANGLNISNGKMGVSKSLTSGGQIHVNSGAELNVNATDGATFADSSSNDDVGGGAILNEGKLTLTGSTFTGNTANERGGAIYSKGTLNITGGTYTGNEANVRGGAVNAQSGTATIKGATFGGDTSDLGNSSSDVGGAIAINSANVTIEDTVIKNNYATNNGGAIFDNKGNLTLTNSVIENNSTAGKGAGIYNSTGKITLTDTVVKDNVVDTVRDTDGNVKGGGAGIYNAGSSGEVTVNAINKDITFSGNKVKVDDGDNGVTIYEDDIYNRGVLTLNAAANRTLALDGGIDGNGSGIMLVNAGVANTGVVKVAGALNGQNVTVAHGELHLIDDDPLLAENPGDYLAGSTVNVESGATINTIDDAIQDLSSFVTLKNGAGVKGDIDFEHGTADKYASDAGTVTYKMANLVGAVGSGVKNIQVASNGTTVNKDAGFGWFNSATGLTLESSGNADGMIKLTGLAGGIAEAADASATVNEIIYDLTADESLDTGKQIQHTFVLNGDGTESTDGGLELAGADLTIADGATVEINELKLAGTGAINNAATGVLKIKDSLVGVNVRNAGILYSDPTTYTETVNNTGILNVDGDTFAATSVLENYGTTNLTNAIFDTGAKITGSGVANLVSGVTTFNNTANTNTVKVASGADFTGALVGGTLDTHNGAIDTIAGSFSDGDVVLDAKLGSTKTIDTVAGGTIKEINILGTEYGTDDSISLAIGDATLDENLQINGMNYYTKVEKDGTNLKFSDKLVNASGMKANAENADFTGTKVNGSTAATLKDALSATNAQVNTNTTAIAGKQDAITESSKLATNLVDTSDSAMFVSADEKSTWNAKQNAITSGSKLASNLVEFTDAESKALASGIDSTKVAAYDAYATTKQNTLTAGSGISLTDDTIAVSGLTTSNLAADANIAKTQLASSVQDSLALADSALQETSALNGANLTAGSVALDKLATTDLSQFDNNTSGFITKDVDNLTNYTTTSDMNAAIAAANKYVSVNSTYLDDASANATGADSVAVGLHATASGDDGAAFGDYASAAGKQSIAIGNSAGASQTGSIAVGAQAKSTGENGIALGNTSKATGTNAIAIGQQTTAGTVAVALGDHATAVDGGIALGQNSNVQTAHGVAIGTGASVAAAAMNSVAIGQNSAATEANTFAVGAAGNERRVVNVATGTADTDAVNVKQLTDTIDTKLADYTTTADMNTAIATAKDAAIAAAATDATTKANQALADAQAYVDGKGYQNATQVDSAMDAKIAALDLENTYAAKDDVQNSFNAVHGEVNDAINTAAADATTKANQALADAQAYVDGKGYQTATQVGDAIDTKIADLDLANTYEAKGAAATAKSEAIAAAAGDATTKANQALQDAKDYVDGKGYKTESEINALISSATSGKQDAIVDNAFIVTDGAGGLKVADASVTDAHLAANAVTTAKVADGAITTAKVAAGAITSDKLDSGVQASLTKANNAVQTVSTGTTDGTITVDGTEVAVAGWNTKQDAISNTSTIVADGTGLKVADGSIGATQLDSSVNASLTKADNSVQTVTTGSSNGTINVDGTDVAVAGLGSLAYEDAASFETAGAAATAEANAKAYTDARLSALHDNSVEMANAYTDKRIESLDKNLSAGVAGAVALSAVATSGVERGEVSVGAGYGYFNGQSAAAFGAAMGLTNRWSINAGAGISNADVSFRAGTNYKFKLF